MNNRQEYNLKIVKRLEEYFIANPDIRFFQALWNLNIIETVSDKIKDKYNEEPKVTYNNLIN